MITKIAKNIEKTSQPTTAGAGLGTLGAVYGAARGTDDERTLSTARNAARGAFGAGGGGLLGAIAGAGLGGLTRNPVVAGTTATLGGLTGAGVGAHKMTNKFAQ